ncbi:MAG: hypothetical protein JNJ47_08470, partial [Alphaproteobacteria bacterium]|nr:hypothetical protein [Alphaproteobacteria bacterium]
MAQLAQTAPSLDHPVHEVRREIKILNKKGELALKLLAALKQKNLEDLSTRNQIFKILKARNESDKTLWAHVYESRDEDAIRIVEETLYAILHAPVCIGSKPSRGIFQLLEIIQPDQMGSVTAYIQDCMRLLADLPILVSGRGEIHEETACPQKLLERSRKYTQADMRIPSLCLTNPETKRQSLCKRSSEVLKPREAMQGIQSRSWEEPLFRQVSLYFAYGFLSQNETILEAISTFVKSQDAEVQAQLESTIQLIFNYLLNDLREAYCRAYFTESSVYNPHLLAACKTYPVLVQEGYAALLGHFLREASQGYLIKLLILPTPDHSCF